MTRAKGSNGPVPKASSKAPPPQRAPVKATTIRFDPAVQASLAVAQSVLRMTANKIVNEAVALYVADRTAAIQTQLEDTLQRLRAYRKADPKFGKAVAAFAAAEAQHARADPIEGGVAPNISSTHARTRADA